MPNWCNNTITLESNDEALLTRFYEENKVESGNGYLSFQRSVPTPSPLMSDDWQSDKAVAASNKEKYGVEGWYDWRVDNWGTKWDVDQAHMKRSQGKLFYAFDTAWSPPVDWVSKVSEKYPSINFTLVYHEEAGMYPSAIVKFKGGEQTSYEEIENENLTEEE